MFPHVGQAVVALVLCFSFRLERLLVGEISLSGDGAGPYLALVLRHLAEKVPESASVLVSGEYLSRKGDVQHGGLIGQLGEGLFCRHGLGHQLLLVEERHL